MVDAEAGHCTWCGALTEVAEYRDDELASLEDQQSALSERCALSETLNARLIAELENVTTMDPDDVPAYVGGLLAGISIHPEAVTDGRP